MKVRNMKSKTGRPVPNQFIIEGHERYVVNGEEQERFVTIFQSYSTVIAKRYRECDGTVVVLLDINAWDYSVTTGKYRNMFLRETKAETQRKIDAGVYRLVDLNAD